ncbi:MAG TPA: 50S ribosomal protein L18 [Ectothiorhodospiraceae bacterium]|nr:50S ribosomal protein L18 [Ectothiorhodospiraceae bacterium]
MNEKKTSRLRRATRARAKIRELGVARLSVNRTPRHIYAQIISGDGVTIVAAASTLEGAVKSEVKNSGNAEAAAVVGRVIAEKAKAAGVSKIAFDRSGFKYHGRVKALAEAARENGLEF